LLIQPNVTADQSSTTNYQLFSDYHTHPQGHRVQLYTPVLLQPWADSARKMALSEIAFTDHDRYHAGINFDAIDCLREQNPDLRIRAGIELDNDPIYSAAGRKWIEQHWNKLDFVLGSVHFLDRADQMFDSIPAGAEQFGVSVKLPRLGLSIA
jgi:histidinol-phosphatase (PHP family)